MNTFFNRVLSIGIIWIISMEFSPAFSTDCDLDAVAKEIARKRPNHPCLGWPSDSEKKLSRRSCKACLGALIPTCQRQNTEISSKDIEALKAYCEALTNPK